MATLTVWRFNDAEGAESALAKMAALQKQELIQIRDAATVTWPMGKKKPKTQQAQNLTGVGALSGAFWGWLFGLLFLVPLLGMAVGAAMGALSGSMADIGIDDDFIDSVRTKVTPGTSALFLLSDDAVVDRIKAEMGDLEMELISSNLSTEQEAKLKELFEEED